MFWIKLGFIIIIVLILISMIKLFLRSILKIEKVKKDFFSFNHINELHRKMDSFLRAFSGITLIILSYVMLFYYEDLIHLILIPVMFFMALDYLLQAFFEWKYSQHPKQSILTLTEMCIILIAIIFVIEFKLLGPLIS